MKLHKPTIRPHAPIVCVGTPLNAWILCVCVLSVRWTEALGNLLSICSLRVLCTELRMHIEMRWPTRTHLHKIRQHLSSDSILTQCTYLCMSTVWARWINTEHSRPFVVFSRGWFFFEVYISGVFCVYNTQPHSETRQPVQKTKNTIFLLVINTLIWKAVFQPIS